MATLEWFRMQGRGPQLLVKGSVGTWKVNSLSAV
jgi:hypothetical protein